MIDINDLPLLLTIGEARKLLRIGRGKAYDMARQGEIPAIRLRGEIRIPRDQLLRMILPQQEIPDVGAKLASVPRVEEAKNN